MAVHIPRSALYLAMLFVFAAPPAPAEEERGFSGRVKVGAEVERKKCTSCSPSELETSVETTVLDLTLIPDSFSDLTFGLKVERDIDGEGDIARFALKDREVEDAVGVYVRRDFTDEWWARAQAEYETSDRNLDVGGRVGFGTDLTDRAELSGYLSLDRRISIGARSTADEGFYVEGRLKFEQEIDDYGVWLQLEGERWFFDSSEVGDETTLTLQPGLWFDLGDSPHVGLVWLELERAVRSGDRRRTGYAAEIGVGVEFDLGDRRKMLAGIAYGEEREKRPDRDTERANLLKLILEYQQRF